MQIKLLKDIVSSVVGAGTSKIVDLLYGKKNVNEFLIAKNLNLTINQTRNVLYKLADEGLVSFVRKKDRKKGGWYTYFWTLNSGKSLHRFKEKLVRDIGALKSQLTLRKAGRLFYCPNCKIEHNEESSLLNGYSCPECGEVLQLKDNAEDIASLEKQTNKHNSLLAEVNTEIGEIDAQEERVKGRRLRAEAKKKEKERAARKKERERLARKEAREKARKKAARKAKKKNKKKR